MAEVCVVTTDRAGWPWRALWYGPEATPAGRNQGASALCLDAAGNLGIVSEDRERWDWPGGRPEPGETLEETMVREVREELCATVLEARLLGYWRNQCLGGPEAGLALVRSVWLARVQVEAWAPVHETCERRFVAVEAFLDATEAGFRDLYAHTLAVAGLAGTEPGPGAA